jgi:small subunit ribosomal protein S16
MVVIRLARGGAKNRPFHHIVVADHRNARDGRFIERLGFYNPMVSQTGADNLRLDLSRVSYWKGKGAIASDAVEKLIRRASDAVTAAPAAAATAPAA